MCFSSGKLSSLICVNVSLNDFLNSSWRPWIMGYFINVKYNRDISFILYLYWNLKLQASQLTFWHKRTRVLRHFIFICHQPTDAQCQVSQLIRFIHRKIIIQWIRAEVMIEKWISHDSGVIIKCNQTPWFKTWVFQKLLKSVLQCSCRDCVMQYIIRKTGVRCHAFYSSEYFSGWVCF